MRNLDLKQYTLVKENKKEKEQKKKRKKNFSKTVEKVKMVDK